MSSCLDQILELLTSKERAAQNAAPSSKTSPVHKNQHQCLHEKLVSGIRIILGFGAILDDDARRRGQHADIFYAEPATPENVHEARKLTELRCLQRMTVRDAQSRV